MQQISAALRRIANAGGCTTGPASSWSNLQSVSFTSNTTWHQRLGFASSTLPADNMTQAGSTITAQGSSTQSSNSSLPTNASRSETESNVESVATSEDASAPTTTKGGMAFGLKQVVQARKGQEVLRGIIHINNTMNNILISLTDLDGNVKAFKSAGSVGFRNARKKQPLAVEKTAEALALTALKLGYGSVAVKMKGMGRFKQLATQVIHAQGVKITELQEVTPIAYNGCRLPGRRRI